MPEMRVGAPRDPIERRFRVRQVRTEVFEVDLVVRGHTEGGIAARARAVGLEAHKWRALDDCTVVDWDPVTIVELIGEDEEGEEVEL